MSRIIKLTVIIAVAMLAWNPVSATGQDCETMNSLIKKERNLLKKKHLLAEALKFCPDDAHIHYSYAYTAERLRKYEKDRLTISKRLSSTATSPKPISVWVISTWFWGMPRQQSPPSKKV